MWKYRRLVETSSSLLIALAAISAGCSSTSVDPEPVEGSSEGAAERSDGESVPDTDIDAADAGAKSDGDDTRDSSEASGRWIPLDLARSSSGELYVVGKTTHRVGDTAHYRHGSFVAKYNPDGALAWTRVFGPDTGDSNPDRAEAVAVGPKGPYVVGATSTTLGDDSRPGGAADAYLANFDPSGERRWVELIGTSERDVALDVALSSTGGAGAYVAGQTEGDLNHRPNNADQADGFVVHHTGTGQTMTYLTRAEHAAAVTSVEPGPDGILYAGGYAKSGIEDRINYDSGFIMALPAPSLTGPKWFELFGDFGSGGRIRKPIALDAGSSGNLYVAGTVEYLVTGGGVKRNGFVLSYTPGKERRWFTTLQSPGGRGNTIEDKLLDIDTDGAGRVYVSGTAQGSMNVDQFSEPEGPCDAVVVQYDSMGSLVDGRQIASPGSDSAHAVLAEPDGSLFAAGATTGDIRGGMDELPSEGGFTARFE